MNCIACKHQNGNRILYKVSVTNSITHDKDFLLVNVFYFYMFFFHVGLNTIFRSLNLEVEER